MTKYLLRTSVALTVSVAAWASGPAFEVASVKLSPPVNGIHVGCSGGPGTADPGRISCNRMNLRSLLMLAYDLKQYQISGPDWMTDIALDIVAKVPAGATKEDVLLMWQNLLAERLQLKTHRDTRELPIYALIVNKGGPKLEQVPDDAPNGAVNNAGAGPAAASGGGGGGGVSRARMSDSGVAPPGGRMGRISGPRMQIPQLVLTLNFRADRPVIDQTNLAGRYKIKLEWSIEETADPSMPSSLFAALQEQLGLKLEARKGPIDLLVVDHMAKAPTDN